VGEAIGVKTRTASSTSSCTSRGLTLPTNIPEAIDADVSNLAIGDVPRCETSGARGCADHQRPGQAVATVSPPMAEEVAATPEATAAVTPAEPEVLTERKPKEEARPRGRGKKAPAAAPKKAEAPKKARRKVSRRRRVGPCGGGAREPDRSTGTPATTSVSASSIISRSS